MEEIEKIFKRIEAACGLPDPAEACRTVLKLVEDARRSMLRHRETCVSGLARVLNREFDK